MAQLAGYYTPWRQRIDKGIKFLIFSQRTKISRTSCFASCTTMLTVPVSSREATDFGRIPSARRTAFCPFLLFYNSQLVAATPWFSFLMLKPDATHILVNNKVNVK